MKLICNNGFYKFYPDFVGEIKLFENKNGIKLYRRRDYWTFEALAEFPNYSLKGQLVYGLNPALVNYAGLPEEVMAKNKLTFNVSLATITPRAMVMINRLNYAGGAFFSFPELPQAFALDANLANITGFEAFVDVRLNNYKVERFFYEDI